MRDAVKLCLTRIKDEDVRDRVNPGEYHIDTTVRIRGTLKVQDDYERQTIMSLPHTEVLALALHLAGVQQDRAIKCIRDAVKECLSQGESAVGCVREQIPTIESEIVRIKREIVEQLPKQSCRGNVRFTAELIEEVTGDNTVDTANNILRELLN